MIFLVRHLISNDAILSITSTTWLLSYHLAIIIDKLPLSNTKSLGGLVRAPSLNTLMAFKLKFLTHMFSISFVDKFSDSSIHTLNSGYVES